MIEIRYNIAISYNKHWNHHDKGENCWCKPIKGMLYLVHRNYEWDGARWVAIKEPDGWKAKESP